MRPCRAIRKRSCGPAPPRPTRARTSYSNGVRESVDIAMKRSYNLRFTVYRRSPHMYDAIVVGARCAGSPTAMLLAKRGYRVLLVDRATFPSDAVSNHYIHQPGVASLERGGLLGKVRASGCPPIARIRFDVGPSALYGLAPAAGGVREGYGPRRSVLDALLVDAAVEAGAELREAFAVQELVWDGGRVAGVRGRRAGGRAVTERA